jgi:hypothetical protein
VEDVAHSLEEIRAIDGFATPASAVEALFVGQG